MNKNKFLIIVIIFLILSHIFLFFIRPHPPKMGENPREIVIEKLHFNQDQIEKYDEIIKIHQEKVRKNEDLMNQNRDELYQELLKNQDSAKINSLIQKIGNVQQETEKIHYQHFLDIKKICKPEQQKDFQELVSELSSLFSKPKRP